MSEKYGLTDLRSLPLPWKTLFTGFLIIMGVGLLIAGAQIMLTHGQADGKWGLSVDDVVYSYYGNRENSRLEAKLNGTMKDKADVHDRAALIKWARTGASAEQWHREVQAIFAKNCIQCHGVIPGLPDFTQMAVAQHLAATDQGVSVYDLTRVSHVHIFGIAFIYLFIGAIFSLASGISPRLKALAIGFPYVFLLTDIASWWLTKFEPSFAYATIVAGVGYNVSSAIMILVSLYQMWIMPRRAQSATAASQP